MTFSPADTELARRLIDSGQAPRQDEEKLAERIRKWRSWDILPATESGRSLGRGRGSVAGRYSSEAQEIAAGMVKAFDVDRRRHHAVRIAWYRQVNVGDKALRKALLAGYDELIKKLDPSKKIRWREGSQIREAYRKPLKQLLMGMTMVDEDGEEDRQATLWLGRLIEGVLQGEPAMAKTMVNKAVDAISELPGAVGQPSNPPTPADLNPPLFIEQDVNGQEAPTELLGLVMEMMYIQTGRLAAEWLDRKLLDATRDLCRKIMTGAEPAFVKAFGFGLTELGGAGESIFVLGIPMVATAFYLPAICSRQRRALTP